MLIKLILPHQHRALGEIFDKLCCQMRLMIGKGCPIDQSQIARFPARPADRRKEPATLDGALDGPSHIQFGGFHKPRLAQPLSQMSEGNRGEQVMRFGLNLDVLQFRRNPGSLPPKRRGSPFAVPQPKQRDDQGQQSPQCFPPFKPRCPRWWRNGKFHYFLD